MLNWSIEFWILLLSSVIFFIAGSLMHPSYQQSRDRTTLYLIFTWWFTSIWTILQALAYLFMELHLFIIYTLVGIVPIFSLIRATDTLTRTSPDPIKIAMLSLYFSGLLFLAFNEQNYTSYELENGDKTFAYAGILNYWVYIITFFLLILWVITSFKIYQNAGPDLKKYARLTLIGGFCIGSLPFLIFLFGIHRILPGSMFLGIAIGAILSSVSFRIEPRLSQLLLRISKDVQVKLFLDLQKQLNLSEARYRNLVENADEIIVELDTEYHILYANTAQNRLLGYSQEEIVNMHAYDLIALQEYQQLQNLTQKNILIRPILNMKIHLKKKTGQNLIVLANIAPYLDEKQKLLRYFVIARNITDIEEAELALNEKNRQLVRIQKIESIGTLAGGLAHDFNNFLQAILGFSELIMMNKDPKSEDYDSVQQIKSVCERGSTIIKQLLIFTRKNDANFRPLDINTEIRGIEKIFESVVPKMIKIHYVFHPQSPKINGDAAQIQQVMMNLILNARDAMPNGGNLTIKTGQIYADEEFIKIRPLLQLGLYYTINVTDDGTGMDEQTQMHLFEPYFTTKEPGKGTGLGLSISYSIIKNHKGMIQCYSQKGLGTEFKIYIPALLNESNNNQYTPESITTYPRGHEQILIVDDEGAIRSYVEQILIKFGYHIFVADSAEQALVKLKAEPKIDLILLDLMMPGIGGKKMVEIIAADPQITAAIIIASGYSTFNFNENPFKNRVKTLLVKPFSTNELLNTIRKVLDSDPHKENLS